MLIKFGQEELSPYNKVLNASTSLIETHSSSSSAINWTRPPPGTYKLNWDAACDKKQGTIGLEAIIRNSDAKFCGLMQATRPYTSNPFTAEAVALWIAANFCKDVGYQNIILKGYAIQVVNLLRSNSTELSEGRVTIEDTRNLLDTLICWSVSHVPGDANVVAHTFAKSASKLVSDLYVLDSIPSVLVSLYCWTM